MYLDDDTLGGSLEDIKSDLTHFKELAHNFGLKLNCSKSELICVEDATRDSILSHFPSLRVTPPERATLHESPIGGIEAIEIILQWKMTKLEKLGERLKVLQAHDALFLLKSAFSLPKLLYTLCRAPCDQSILLSSFDSLQMSLLESICYIHLTESGWLQASLPPTFGGSGVRVQSCWHRLPFWLQLLAVLLFSRLSFLRGCKPRQQCLHRSYACMELCRLSCCCSPSKWF